MINALNTVWATVQAFGTISFFLLVIVAGVLWRIHPVLGIIAVLFLFAIMLGFL